MGLGIGASLVGGLVSWLFLWLLAEPFARIVDVLENPGGARDENELLGIEFGCNRRGHGVGIDIQQHTGFVAGQRADDGHQSVVELLAENIGFHRIDVADEAVIDCVFALALHRRPFVRTNQAGIDPADTHSRNLQVTAAGENLGIDLAVENHCGDIERIAVGHAPSFDELGIESERGREFR